MATAIVSGRVDELVKERAAIYIREAGLTFGDVINELMLHIVRSKSIPRFEDTLEIENDEPFGQFLQFRKELHWHRVGNGIPEMTNAELHEYLAAERLKDYEALS